MPKREMLLNATNVKVPSYIPHDIIFSILSKLPLKSFRRFQSACKSWSLLFDDPCFMNMYGKSFLAKDSSYYDDKTLLLHLLDEGYDNHLYSFFGERFENRVELESLKPPFHLNHFDILGSVSINGILCLRIYSIFNYDVTKLILWNSTTREFKEVPSSPFGSISSGRHDVFVDHLVGYDSIKDDYKIIRIEYDTSLKIYREIYSLSSNSWKILDIDVPICNLYIRKVYMDGVCHWWDRDETHAYVVSFDFSCDSVIKTFMPSDLDHRLTNLCTWMVLGKLMILNGSLAFFSNYLETSTFHISILGEIGVKESWAKLFVVGLSPDFKCCIGAGRNGKMLFIKEDKKLVWFDLSTGMIDEIGVKAVSFRWNILFQRESILSIRRNIE
ncbi:putative F-box protein At3g20705 [Vicia villosa]|uniref:putative F-box protein At3g20705 n=1 Tax=Vicia villosa TaxID=3911 RepID=UPI00273ADAB1|nr:putative F-box protein At3g20705 [Vicia villosa]